MKRFILYIFTYILITIASAAGTITITNVMGAAAQGNTVEQESTAVKLMNSIMDIGGAEVEIDLNLTDREISLQSASTKNSSIVINFKGNINIANLDNIKLNGNLKLNINGEEIALFIAYYNDTIYISNETINLKVETSNLSKIFELIPLLGVDLNLGLDLSTFSIDSILQSLESNKEERIDDNTIKIPLELFENFTINIFSDNQYNITNISGDNLCLDNYLIDLNLDLVKNQEIEIVDPEEDTTLDYVDVTNTLNIVDSIKEIINNKKLHLDVNIDMQSNQGISLIGKIDIDFNNELLIATTLQLLSNNNSYELNFVFKDSSIYVDFNDIKFMVDKDAINEIVEIIYEKLNLESSAKNILINLLPIISNLDLSKLIEGDFSAINIDNLLEFSNGEDESINITIKKDFFGLTKDLNINIILDDEDKFAGLKVSGLELLGKEISLDVGYSNNVNIPTINENDYLNFNKLPNLLNALINSAQKIVKDKKISLDIDSQLIIDNSKINISGNVNIDFYDKENLKIYSTLLIDLYNKQINIKLSILDDTIYLEIDNLKFRAKLSEINELIEAISQSFNAYSVRIISNYTSGLISNAKNLVQILNFDISKLNQIIKEININDTNVLLILNKDAIQTSSDISLILNYNEEIESVNVQADLVDNVKLDLNIKTEQTFVENEIIESEYTSLKYAKNLITASLNSVNKILSNNKLALKVKAQLKLNNQLINLNGILAIDSSCTYLKINLPIDNKEVDCELYLIDNIIYANIDGLKFYTTINDIKEILKILKIDDIDLSDTIESLFPKYIIDEIKEFNFESLNLGIIKNINILENSTEIELSKDYIDINSDIQLTLNYDNLITSLEIFNINLSNVKANLTASLDYDFEIEQLDIDEFNNLTNIDRSINALLNSLNKILNEKTVAFNLDIHTLVGNNEYNLSGDLFIDFVNVSDIKNIDFTNIIASANLNVSINGVEINLILNLENGYAYINFNELKLKISIGSIEELITNISLLFKTDYQLDIQNILLSYFDNSILNDILNKNYDKLSLSLIKSVNSTVNELVITFDKSLLGTNEDITIILTNLDNKLDTIKIENFGLGNILFDKLSMQILTNYNYSNVVDSDYFEISGINQLIKSLVNTYNGIYSSKQIIFEIEQLNLYLNDITYQLSGVFYLDYSKAFTINNLGEIFVDIDNLMIYTNLSIIEYNKSFDSNSYTHNIELLYDTENLYLTYNNLSICIDTYTIESIFELIAKLTNNENLDIINNIEINFNEVIQNILCSINTEENASNILSTFNANIIKYLNISNNKLDIIIDKNLLGSSNDISLEINYSEKLGNISLQDLCLNNLSLDIYLNLLTSYNVPNVDITKYSNLNNIDEFIDSAVSTIKKIERDKRLSFNISSTITNTTYSYDENNMIVKGVSNNIDILDSSLISVNWVNAIDDNQSFDINKISIYAKLDIAINTITEYYNNGIVDNSKTNTNSTTHSIEVRFVDNTIYLAYNNMKIKLTGEGLDLAINSICEMMQIDIGTNSLNNLINLILNFTNNESFTNKLRIEMIKSISLTDSNLSATIDLSDLNVLEGLNELDFNISYDKESLESININNLNIANFDISSVNINLRDYETVDDLTEEEKSNYMDISSIGNLIEAVKNTIKFTDFHITGNVDLNLNVIGIDVSFNVPIDAYIKVVEGKIEGKIILGPVPVISKVNDDVPYKFGNTISGINPGKDRILTVYLKNNMAYFYRTEKVPVFASSDRVYEKKLKVHMDTLLLDPLYYFLDYGLGLSDSIMQAIYDSLNIEREKPIDYSNILKGFNSNGNLYTMTLNLFELTANPQLDTMSLGVKVIDYQNQQSGQTLPVIGGLTLNMFMPIADNVTITLNSENLTLVNIGESVDLSTLYEYTSNYEYKEGAEWDAYDGLWNLSSQRKFSLMFETNCDEKIDSVQGIAGSSFILPSLNKYVVDDNAVRSSYTFAGWYTTSTFDVGSEYRENIFPRSDTVLYAKWIVDTKNYITISFETNGGAPIDSIKVLEGQELDLPTYFDVITVEENGIIYIKQFDSWYMDKDLTIKACDVAPDKDIILYAKWSIVSEEHSYTLNIFDNGQKILSKRLLENDDISLTSNNKFNETTKYYIDSSYCIEFTNMIMPNHDLNLYIRNLYNFTISSQYGEIVNINTDYYQSEIISLPQQYSYYYDDGTQTERIIYSFEGYYIDDMIIEDINNFVMPNKNIEVVAKWIITIKEYFTVTFSKDTNVISAYKDSIVFPVNSIKVLEGETLNLSQYIPTWIYKTGSSIFTVWWHYEFEGWTTELGGGNITQITVTGDTTIYANWDGVVKTGKG